MKTALTCLESSGNLGNARLQGLEESVLGNDDTRYSIALSCF